MLGTASLGTACQLPSPLRLGLAPRQQLVAGPRLRSAAAAPSPLACSWWVGRQLFCQPLQARRREHYDRDYVQFDDEEDWEQSATTIQPGVGPIFSTVQRGLSAITDKLTDVALQLAPADTSPAVVRVAVGAGLFLMALSFVKSLLSFFLTLGTVILGGYVAVKVFGLDVGMGGDGGGGSRDRGRSRIRQQQANSRPRPDSRSRHSEFKGLLGSGSKEDEDGLLDVWFQRKSGGSSGKQAGSGKKRR